MAQDVEKKLTKKHIKDIYIENLRELKGYSSWSWSEGSSVMRCLEIKEYTEIPPEDLLGEEYVLNFYESMFRNITGEIPKWSVGLMGLTDIDIPGHFWTSLIIRLNDGIDRINGILDVYRETGFIFDSITWIKSYVEQHSDILGYYWDDETTEKKRKLLLHMGIDVDFEIEHTSEMDYNREVFLSYIEKKRYLTWSDVIRCIQNIQDRIFHMEI